MWGRKEVDTKERQNLGLSPTLSLCSQARDPPAVESSGLASPAQLLAGAGRGLPLRHAGPLRSQQGSLEWRSSL